MITNIIWQKTLKKKTFLNEIDFFKMPGDIHNLDTVNTYFQPDDTYFKNKRFSNTIFKVKESKLGHPIKTIKIKSNTYSGIFYKDLITASVILNFLKSEKEVNILEIGAGLGVLQVILNKILNKTNVTLIDFKKNLNIQKHYLSNEFKNNNKNFFS